MVGHHGIDLPPPDLRGPPEGERDPLQAVASHHSSKTPDAFYHSRRPPLGNFSSGAEPTEPLIDHVKDPYGIGVVYTRDGRGDLQVTDGPTVRAARQLALGIAEEGQRRPQGVMEGFGADATA